MNANANTTTNKSLGDIISIADLSTLEMLLSSTGRVDIFTNFKNLLSLIFDTTLKETLLKFFICLTGKEDKESVELKAKDLACYIEKLFESPIKSSEHLMDAYVGLECNFLILLSIVKSLNKKHSIQNSSNENKKFPSSGNSNLANFHNYQSIFFYTDKKDEDTISKDICSLININDYFQNYLTTFIKYLKYYLTLIRTKEYFSTFLIFESKISEIIGNKLVISNLEYFLDFIFFSTKYLFTPTCEDLQNEININLEDFKNIVIDYFSVLFEYLMINYKIYQKMINDKLSNLPYFQNYLTLCILINSTVTTMKLFPNSQESFSPNSNILIDFNTFYPAFNDFFVEYFFSGLKFKIISKLNDLISIYQIVAQKNFFDNFQFETIYFPPYLLNMAKESMSDLLVSHFIALNVNENNFEVENKGYWLKSIIQCYCFTDLTENFYKIMFDYKKKFDKYSNPVLKKNGHKSNFNFINLDSQSDEFLLKFEITEILSKALKNYKIIIPRRLMMFKEIYAITYLIITNYFLIKLPDLRDATYWNKSFFDDIEEYKNLHSKFFFILCSSIEELLMKENYKKKLRIYGLSAYPFDYVDIFQETQKNKNPSENFTHNYSQGSSSQQENSSQNSEKLKSSSSAKKINQTENSVVLNKNFSVSNFQLPGNININKENQSINIAQNNINIPMNYFSNPVFSSSILFKKPASSSRNDIFPYSQSKKKKSKKIKVEYTTIKFDITPLIKDSTATGSLNPQNFLYLENKSDKNIILSTKNTSSHPKHFLKINVKNSSSLSQSCFVLFQKNDFLDTYNEISFNNIYSSSSPDSQSFNFLKEILSCELMPKIESDCLVAMEVLDYDIISYNNSNLSPSEEKFSNCLANLKSTFRYYDLNDKLEYEEVLENLIKLLE